MRITIRQVKYWKQKRIDSRYQPLERSVHNSTSFSKISYSEQVTTLSHHLCLQKHSAVNNAVPSKRLKYEHQYQTSALFPSDQQEDFRRERVSKQLLPLH